TIDDAQQTEGNNLEFTVNLSSVSCNTVSVDYATSDGTALAMTDYTASTGTLTLAPGEISGIISIPTLTDLDDECPETIVVTLSNASNSTITGHQGLGYLRDIIPVYISSFSRQVPVAQNTNADQLVFRVMFNCDVQNLNDADFEVSGTTASITNISPVVASRVYDITVSGGDLSNLNGIVGIDVSATHNISDVSGYILAANEPSIDETYIVDNTAPAAPSVLGISDDTGISNSDGITTDQTLIFSGTAEASSILELFEGSNSIGTAITDGSGSWTLSVTLADGTYSVTAKATDQVGNESLASAIYTLIIDNTKPTVVTKDLTVQLDGSGSATIIVADINDGSSDNQAIDNLSIDITSFDCSNKGANTITLTVTDVAGNSETGTSTVTVEDSEDPTVLCVSDQVEDTDNGVCSYAHSGTGWDATGTDNCPGFAFTYILSGATTGTGASLDNVLFNKGVTTVEWTNTDAALNTAACSYTVTVEDNEDPTVSCTTNQTVDTDNG
ncbi:MAG: hypothetical protein GY790_21505, partial [Bacteroidetes bacterium]|nr:hypothetical protein [Bacteroidota bacterium]